MLRIALVTADQHPLADPLLKAIADAGHPCDWITPDKLPAYAGGQDTAFVYLPSLTGRHAMVPDLPEAEMVFLHTARHSGGPSKFILCSSALIYGTAPGRQSLVGEDYQPPRASGRRIPGRWRALESLARRRLDGRMPLTILRPVTVLAPDASMLSRRLLRRLAFTLPGHNPTLQLLSVTDLAQAVICACIMADRHGVFHGVFNVAPDAVVPLHAALRSAGHLRMPVPRTLQKIGGQTESLEYLRYSWTVSNGKIRRELGFQPRRSSLASLLELSRPAGPLPAPEPAFDDFGMDAVRIDRLNRTLFRFLAERYWRIETAGLENLPGRGRAVLVGTHRGFMPWDAVMALHVIVRATGRVPRFLTHPGLLKFPFIASFITSLGGVVACQESAARILESNEMLGVFPEGVDGAFTLYRDAYKLHAFGRDAFVKMALRHRAPIVPFVTVGSAESLPVFAQIRSRRWTRYSTWPCVPLSTFPFVPFPLPSKWHMRFLQPMHVEQQYPPEAARDGSVIKAISLEVRARMQQAVDEIVRQRKSIFWGTVFGRREKAETRAADSRE